MIMVDFWLHFKRDIIVDYLSCSLLFTSIFSRYSVLFLQFFLSSFFYFVTFLFFSCCFYFAFALHLIGSQVKFVIAFAIAYHLIFLWCTKLPLIIKNTINEWKLESDFIGIASKHGVLLQAPRYYYDRFSFANEQLNILR